MQNRRSFILGAAGLVVVPGLPIPFVRSAIAADPSLLYHADMSVSSFGDYARDGGPSGMGLHASGNSPIITTERSRAGNKSLKVELNRQSSTTSYRTEVSTGPDALDFFKTFWIGFSIYVPADWEISTKWGVLFQIHDSPVDWSIGFNPIFSIAEKENSDNWHIKQRFVNIPEDKHTKDDQVTAIDELFGTIATGAWTDWVIQYRPDYRLNADGGQGITRVWRNGERIIDYSGPNAYNQESSPYIKFGAYRSSWKDRDVNDSVIERLYYFDEFRVSRPDLGSYDLVTPGAIRQVENQPSPPVWNG